MERQRRGKRQIYYGDINAVIGATYDLPNVFYEPVNEFSDAHEDVDIARSFTYHLLQIGLLVSCGAWGYSTHGHDYSDEFDPINSNNQIINIQVRDHS